MTIQIPFINKKLTFRKPSPGRVVLYIAITALVVFTAMPLVYLVLQAFKPLDEMFIYPPRFFVQNPTTRNFNELFIALEGSTVPFLRYVFNSAFTSAATVLSTVFVCSAGAYALTKLKMPGTQAIFQVIIASLMFSPPVAQITNFVLVNELGMMNTYWALIIPKIAGSYNLFLLKQNFDGIPNALLEAAKMDGCSPWKIYWKMIMPMTRPAWATVVVFAFVGAWNDFTSALIYIQAQAFKTLPLALQLLQGGVGQVARAGAFNAAALITTVPTIAIFVFMQSKVIKTMAHTGIK